MLTLVFWKTTLVIQCAVGCANILSYLLKVSPKSRDDKV
jgi:hypothetical protein